MTDAGAAMHQPSTDELARRFREWAEVDGPGYAPMYMQLAYAAAEDPSTLEILATAPPGQRRPVMFFAAIHDLLLRGFDHELARWYPDLDGSIPDRDPGPVLLDFCAQHRDELIDVVATHRVQTNEVGRAAALLPALRVAQGALGGPVALVEIGASAGLNLLFDRFGYRYSSRAGTDIVAGDPDSPVHLRAALVGNLVPPVGKDMPDVPERVGIDLQPVDVTDPEAARWLRACVFAEQIERRARLDAALELAATARPRVVEGDAVEVLPQVVADLPDGLPVCLWHSWTLTYFPRERRAHFADAVAKIATEREVVWLSFEAPDTAPGVPRPPTESDAAPPRRQATVVGMARMRSEGPVGRALARSHPHVTWLEWLDPASG